MKIIVGLGNIGEKYLKTRHNCGFLALDQFEMDMEKENIELKWKKDKKMKAYITKFDYKGETVLLVKPTTLMNLSGEAVSKILNFYKEKPENLIVIYDDIDLPLGTIRCKDSGSAGTHNGMKSIIQEIGSKDFKRIRIGIESRGELTPAQQDLHSFVLSDFTENEFSMIFEALKDASTKLKETLA